MNGYLGRLHIEGRWSQDYPDLEKNNYYMWNLKKFDFCLPFKKI